MYRGGGGGVRGKTFSFCYLFPVQQTTIGIGHCLNSFLTVSLLYYMIPSDYYIILHHPPKAKGGRTRPIAAVVLLTCQQLFDRLSFQLALGVMR